METLFTRKNLTVGDKIVKYSGKPFKCGFKVATIFEFTINPHTNKDAIIIKEDNSIVDLDKVYKYEK